MDHGKHQRYRSGKAAMQTILIGHRGEPSSYPENSLAGFEAALRAGALYIETDVQLTADGVPLLHHDADVARLTGHDHVVMQTDYATLNRLSAGYPARFGARFADLRLARLGDLATLLNEWPRAVAFVEVKQESIAAFGVVRVMNAVLAELREVLTQCVIISFEREPLSHARAASGCPVGWVLPGRTGPMRVAAEGLRPEYLICSRRRLPAAPEPLWPGPWKWVAYTANTVQDVLALRARGVDMIETDAIRKLLHDSRNGGAEA
jgi:glycerophosphoryl diester phosphodiesterase